MEEETRSMEEEDASNGGGAADFSNLPEGCISHALSLTTPRDACRAAAASATFRSAAASDTVWERFLPPDCAAILSRSVDPVEFSSKRDLFFLLRDSILLDGGKRSFAIDQETGKKCFMISAREMGIIWGDTPPYWQWISLPESRFPECAQLMYVWWLEIHGKIDTRELSEETNYVAYLVFKLVDGSWASDYTPLVASMKLENSEVVSTHIVRLESGDEQAPAREEEEEEMEQDRHFPRLRWPFQRRRWPWNLLRHPEEETPPAVVGPTLAPHEREDGWMEVMVGEFYNKFGDDGELDASLLETNSSEMKKGLVIHGMEFRPKKPPQSTRVG